MYWNSWSGPTASTLCCGMEYILKSELHSCCMSYVFVRAKIACWYSDKVTNQMSEESWFDLWQGHEIYPFFRVSRLVMGPSQPFDHWVCVTSPGSKMAAVSSQPVILLRRWEWVELYFHLFICLCSVHGKKFAVVCDYSYILIKMMTWM